MKIDPTKYECPMCGGFLGHKEGCTAVPPPEKVVITRGPAKISTDRDHPLRCPLCYASFAMEYFQGDKGKGKVLLCRLCKIGIMADDPFVGRWEEAAHTIPDKDKKCPTCGYSPMRFFFTSTGYMKAMCPVKECRTAIASSSPDRKAGQVVFMDELGREVKPSSDRPIAAPENPSVMQEGSA